MCRLCKRLTPCLQKCSRARPIRRGVGKELNVVNFVSGPTSSLRGMNGEVRKEASPSIFPPAMSNRVITSISGASTSTTYERLVALKNKYDPTNLFRMNQNIKPTA
jgi:hypothetical protein